MTKKGVSVVSGITSPIVGEKYTYNIVSWYPQTPESDRKPEKVTWELFRKRKNGTFTTTNIKKKGRSEFTFGEAAAGEVYKLQAYLYESEGGGLIIKPKPAKIPKINKVELFYIDDKKGMIFSYMEKLRARAYCINMTGKYLIFTLWEDDAKGAGHNSKNQPVATLTGQVNKDGFAVVDFSLSPFIFKAAMGEKDTKLEFYVTVEYFKDKKHASTNVNVKNPIPNVPQNQKKNSEPKKTKPKKTTIAKGSPAENKGNSKKEEKGIWDSFTESISMKGGELWDWVESVGTAVKDKLPTIQKPDGKSPAIIKPDTNKYINEGCPRCRKLTESELKAVFPSLDDSALITEIIDSFNQYCEKFNVNTCTLKAHFFAQAKQESGDSLSPAIKGENMNYNIAALKTTGFLNVSTSYMFGNKNGIEMANDLGRKKNEGALNLERQVKIANFVYGLDPKAKSLGNNAPSDNKSLSENDNEGWRYRGRGMLQITGKSNYINIENHVNKVLAQEKLNIKAGRTADNKFTATEALLSGIGDWDLHKMYIPAKVGVTKNACLNIIKIINSKTKSKTKRVAHLLGGTWYEDDKTTGTAHTIKEKDSMKFIFRVKECKLLNPVDDAVKSNENGVLEEMKKLVDKHIPYSQSGSRNELTEEGLANLDCSETVGIYLHKLGVMPTYKAIDTSTMTTEKNFRNTIGSNNLDLVAGSDKSDFKPQRGDVFVWRKGAAGPGHTGIVYQYDETNDIVTILEAIGSVGAVSEKDQANNGGYSGTGCSRTAKYSRLKGALYGHKGWAGYFRPKNYTKKL